MYRIGLVLCLVIAGLGGVGVVSHGSAFAATGGNSDAAHACQNGGYAILRGSDGTTFKNEGQCVAYAAKGGYIPGVGPCKVTATTGCLTFNGITLPSWANATGITFTVTASFSFDDTCFGECYFSSLPNNLAIGGGTYVERDMYGNVLSSGIFRVADTPGSTEGLGGEQFIGGNADETTCAGSSYARAVAVAVTMIDSSGATQSATLSANTGVGGGGALQTGDDTYVGSVPSTAVTC